LSIEEVKNELDRILKILELNPDGGGGWEGTWIYNEIKSLRVRLEE